MCNFPEQVDLQKLCFGQASAIAQGGGTAHIVYGCTSWTMTRAREALIRTVRRKMMRTLAGISRLVQDDCLETYLEWIVRATSAAETAMSTFDVPDWVGGNHRRKFRWAGQAARRTDGRWTREFLEWSATGTRKEADRSRDCQIH